MAESTSMDLSKMKVIDLRKELRARGLRYSGDKAELVKRLEAAISESHEDVNLDSDELDSDEDDKTTSDHDVTVDPMNEDFVLEDNPLTDPKELSSVSEESLLKETTLKRTFTYTLTCDASKDKTNETEPKETGHKKIVLNRGTPVASTTVIEPVAVEVNDQLEKGSHPSETDKVKITADLDLRTKLELRAKRFGLPVNKIEVNKKEARMQRFGHNVTIEKATAAPEKLTQNIDKLQKRAIRFGLSVSKVMTDIEKKNKLEKRKAKFNTGI